MPIIFDTSEAQHLTPGIVCKSSFLSNLESETGADFVLSTWDAPADNDALLWEHVKRGEGIQLKRGLDLVSSVYDRRLINQLYRMLQWWKQPWLLHHCRVSQKEGIGLFDGNQSRGKRKFTYQAYISTLRAWQMCGGYVTTLDADYPLSEWIDDELDRMRDDQPTRIISGSKGDKEVEIVTKDNERIVMTEMVRLTPQEQTLATFPGIGSTRAHDLWQELPNHGARQTLVQALCWMTDGYANEYVKGFGKGMEKLAKQHLGVGEGERLVTEKTEGWMKVNDIVEVREETDA